MTVNVCAGLCSSLQAVGENLLPCSCQLLVERSSLLGGCGAERFVLSTEGPTQLPEAASWFSLCDPPDSSPSPLAKAPFDPLWPRAKLSWLLPRTQESTGYMPAVPAPQWRSLEAHWARGPAGYRDSVRGQRQGWLRGRELPALGVLVNERKAERILRARTCPQYPGRSGYRDRSNIISISVG